VTYSVRYDWPETDRRHHRQARCRRQRFMAMTTVADLLALMTEGDPLGVASP
jgi:acetyl-CoA C-acetyltransferase